MFIMMNYKKPKRYFEKSGVVDSKASYYVSIVMFDPKTKVGELCTPQKHILEGKEILSFNIGIGR
jgi:hypothetical protein